MAVIGLLLVVCGLGCGDGPLVQERPAQPADQATTAAPPAFLDRIREGLAKEQTLKLETPEHAHFRVEIEGHRFELPDWRDDPMRRWTPAPSRSAVHDEFLRLVTPRAVGNPYTNGELAQVLATSIAFALTAKAVKAGIDKARRDAQARELERIREQIARELAALAAAKPTPGNGPPKSDE